MADNWWDKIQNATAGVTGGGTTGAPPPPSVAGSSGSGGITYTQHIDYDGSVTGVPGATYSLGSNGSVSIISRPSTSGGSGGVSVSLNPNSTSAWSVREMPDGSLWRINELTGEMVPLTGAPKPYRDPSGYDPSTGLPYGVVRVSTDVSPTGLVYQGKPVNADGSLFTPGSAVPGWSNVTKGPGGMYGINDQTGQYGIIPGSEQLGSAPSNQPATYSGGGGGSGAASAYSSIATAQINAQSRLAAIEAESQARAAAAQQEADLQKQLIQLQQNFQREQAAISNALAAAGQSSQIAVANAQLKQQYEQNRVALIGQFRESLKDYDARAVNDLLRQYGSLQGAVGQGANFLTDNANAGAAALLGAYERPFEPIPEYDPFKFMGQFGAGGLGGTVTGGTGGSTGGGGSSTTGGSGGATGTPFSVGGVDTGQMEKDLRAQGVPEAEIAQIMAEMAQGQRAVNDYALSQYYRGLGGSGQFLRSDGMGGRAIAGEGIGGAHELQGNYSGVWQTVDPYAPNYKSPNDPMFAPSWAQQPTSTSGMAGAGGDFVPPTEPIPANHPLAGGLTGGVTNPQDTVIPMLAGGGMARGAFITGDSLSGKPTGNEELVIAPGGAHVIPLGKMGAQQLIGNLPRFAMGTLSGGTLSRTRTTPTYYVAPEPEPTPTYTNPTNVVGATETQALPTYTPSAQSTPAVGSVAPQPTSTQAPVSPVSSPTPAPAPTTPTTPTTPVNPLDSVYTPEQQGLLDQVMAYRTGTADMNLGFNPWDVAFQGLTPFEQTLYYNNEAQKRGIPAELFRQDVAMRSLAGVGGGLAGRIGY